MSLYMKKANRWQHLFDVQVRAKEGALMALFCSQQALLSKVGPCSVPYKTVLSNVFFD